MMRWISAIISSLFFLVGCNSGQQPNTGFGEMDMQSIAGDTLLQKGLENSFEYIKTVNLSDTSVLDVTAWGSPAQGELALVYRSKTMSRDTLFKTTRAHLIRQAEMADLDLNKRMEIYAYGYTAGKFAEGAVYAFQLDNRKVTPIAFSHTIKEETYRGKDSFYIEGNYLVRQFPLYASTDSICCPTQGRKKVFYRLNGSSLLPADSDLLP